SGGGIVPPLLIEEECMTGQSQELNELAAALSKAQGEMTLAELDAIGQIGGLTKPGRKYPYATLGSVWQTMRNPLSKHGLALVQTTEPGGPDEIRLVTTLIHASGQYVSGTLVLPVTDRRPQGYGTVMTYARRYAAAAMAGVAAEDDDGQTAENGPAPFYQPAAATGSVTRAADHGFMRPQSQGTAASMPPAPGRDSAATPVGTEKPLPADPNSAFFVFAKTSGLTVTEALDAVGVKKLTDLSGGAAVALERLQAVVAERTAPSEASANSARPPSEDDRVSPITGGAVALGEDGDSPSDGESPSVADLDGLATWMGWEDADAAAQAMYHCRVAELDDQARQEMADRLNDSGRARDGADLTR
ncbi:MAG: ERF family protein, partial [Chloroflexota bacterium]